MIDDLAYLAQQDYRPRTLTALVESPRSQSELWDTTGTSSSVIQRTLREFENRSWVHHDGDQYETTPSGEYIATKLADVTEWLGTDENVWQWLPGEASGFDIEMCLTAEATVTNDEPARVIDRYRTLLETTTWYRFAGVDLLVLDPLKDPFCHRVHEGLEAEVIVPPPVVRHIRRTYPRQMEEVLATGNLTIRVHDDVPSYGVSLFEDRVAISGYDPAGKVVRVLLDTNVQPARTWAESVYESLRRHVPTYSLESSEE